MGSGHIPEESSSQQRPGALGPPVARWRGSRREWAEPYPAAGRGGRPRADRAPTTGFRRSPGGGQTAGAHAPLGPPRVLLNRTEPQFLTVCTVSRRVTGGKRRVDPRRGSGRPRRQPRRLGSHPLASAGPASALPSHFSRPATRCLSWESLKRGSQVYLLRVTLGQAIVLVGACYPIPGS